MEITYFITAIVSLAGCIVTLALHIKHLNKKHSEERQKNTIDLIAVVTKNNLVIENNTKAHERVFEYLLNGKKK